MHLPVFAQIPLFQNVPESAHYRLEETGDTTIIRSVKDSVELMYVFRHEAQNPCRFIVKRLGSAAKRTFINHGIGGVTEGILTDSIKVTDMCVQGDTCYFCGYKKKQNGYTVLQDGRRIPVFEENGIVGKFHVNTFNLTIDAMKYAVYDEMDRFVRIVARSASSIGNAQYLTVLGKKDWHSWLYHINIPNNTLFKETPVDSDEEIADLVVNNGMLMEVSRFYHTENGRRKIANDKFGIRFMKESESSFANSVLPSAWYVDIYRVPSLSVTNGNLDSMCTKMGIRLAPYVGGSNVLVFSANNTYENRIIACRVDMQTNESGISRTLSIPYWGQDVKDVVFNPDIAKFAILTKDNTHYIPAVKSLVFVTSFDIYNNNGIGYAHMYYFKYYYMRSLSIFKNRYWICAGFNNNTGKLVDHLQDARVFDSECGFNDSYNVTIHGSMTKYANLSNWNISNHYRIIWNSLSLLQNSVAITTECIKEYSGRPNNNEETEITE